MNEVWIPRSYRDWASLPIGTKAKALMGGWWIKCPCGWAWNKAGGGFSTPGGDATGEICLPDPNDPDVIAALAIVPRKPL
jgi:hypothetical protein